ncbi:unnamed protein product [Parnassius apollo]|uniref:(apollo) hypothetical protein n=1 Tax=Parnassius apollo TaxID=110799 RepID=A0A8S3W5I1_PARAO|nr:unnamed protein product [Parnassius apollo]
MSPLWIVLTLLPILGGAERFNCRGRILGAYYADVKSGCKAFHVCVNVAGGGIRDFRFYCPPGTLFHQEAQTCTDWGDDDALACPADIYDGFDTRKLSHDNRDDEAEFGLQRAETGDRRLSQNNGASNTIPSDLRAAHSSDFFSGQRDRGRDDPMPPAPNAQVNAEPVLSPVSSSRQSFRRATTSRPKPTTTQYATNNSPDQYPTSLPPKPNRYNQAPKRKLTRKRPIYTTTQSPTTFASNTFSPKVYSEQAQNYNRRIPSQNTQDYASTVNVPPQYKDEYVEVSRVTPKPIRYFPSSPSSTPFNQPLVEPQPNKKSGLAEEYKYDTQSITGLKAQNENRPFKVRNSFSVVPDIPNENDFLRSQSFNRERGTPTTTDFSTTTRVFLTSTPAYRNVNSISYEQEKNNYNQFPSSKQNYFYNPTTTPSTIATAYTTTTRYEPPQSLNTIAYNTNNAFNVQSSNFAESNEDDGQYRPPEGEDDGQYRPELYEKELLSGAHSLNIAASGNRLLEDQKAQSKNQFFRKPGARTSAPRPFRPASSVVTSTQLPIIPEITYSTTLRSVPDNTQRTFDYYQTYTTTSRPFESKVPGPANNNALSYDSTPARIASTSVPRTYDLQRNQNRETPQPTNAPAPAPKPSPRPHHFAKPAHNKEDTSYDYAYYDSDPGFSEYDQIEEFGRTNTKGSDVDDIDYIADEGGGSSLKSEEEEEEEV